MRRREISLALASLAGWSAAFGQAAGESRYPDRPLKLLVPWAPGGINDALARLAAERLGSVLKQAVVVENRAGANGQIAYQAALQAPPDGHTLLLITSGQHILSVALGTKLPYNPLADFTPLAQIGEFPVVLVARKDLPVNNIKELLLLARSRKVPLSVSVSAPGALSHLAAERLMAETGIALTVIPYRGEAPSMMAVLSGEVDLGIVGNPAQYVHDKQMKALAVTTASRWSVLPDVPTMVESGLPGFVSVGWAGVAVPSKVPRPIIDTLVQAFQTSLNTDSMRSAIRAKGAEPSVRSSRDFASSLEKDLERYRTLVRSRNIKVEQ